MISIHAIRARSRIRKKAAEDAKSDFTGTRRALERWVGGFPVRASEGVAIFAYRIAGAERVALTGSQDLLVGDTVRTQPDMVPVSLVDVFGITPTITYMRWQ